MLIGGLSNIKTPGEQISTIEQVHEEVPIETEEQAHIRKSKLFEMALSAISVASLNFSTVPAKKFQDT